MHFHRAERCTTSAGVRLNETALAENAQGEIVAMIRSEPPAGGHTWDTENTLVLRNDGFGSGSDLGYPIRVETAPGEVFAIYYITNEDGITHIAGTVWQVPDAP